MADDDFPTDYDAIVLGTGMTECIVAAALSRIGQKVLHLDRNDYYSGDWGTFHFEALQTWIAEHSVDGKKKPLPQVDLQKQKDLLKEGENLIPLRINSEAVSNVKDQVHIPDELPEPAVELKEQEQSKTDTDESVVKSEEQPETSEAKKAEEGGTDDAPSTTDKESVDLPTPETSPDEEKKMEESEKKETIEEPPKVPETKKKVWCFNDMRKRWRDFNVDLQPKVLYCSGPMVELLISSDIAKYCEFKSITRIITLLNGCLQQVPCSRSDVFSSRLLSMIEKRMLMKFLTFSVEYEKHPEEYQEFENKPFEEFLKSRKLSANVTHYIKNAIAMATNTTSTIEGLKSTCKFLRSLGRYGNTAFLWPLYGSGELPQCFCRMCAVFGGVYCLRRTGASLIVDKDRNCTGVIDTEGVRLNAKYVIGESSYITDEVIDRSSKTTISRGIFVTDKSIKGSDSEHISLLMVPSGEKDLLKVLELCPSSHACPKETYLVHMTCEGVRGPEEDLAPATNSLFQSESEDAAGGDSEEARPKVLWSLYFSQEDTNQVALESHEIGGLHLVASPDIGLDFDLAISQARAIFEKLCPGEEFLPKAPNPEDIIYDNDQQGPNQEGSGFEPTEEKTAETKTNDDESSSSPKETGKQPHEEGSEKTEQSTESASKAEKKKTEVVTSPENKKKESENVTSSESKKKESEVVTSSETNVGSESEEARS